MIADEGVDALKVRALSRRAGLNDRYFYESFADVEELLDAVVAAQMDVALARLAAVDIEDLDDPSIGLSQLTRMVVTVALDVVEEPTIARLVVQSQQYPTLRRHRRLLVDALVELTEYQGRRALGDQVVAGSLPRLAATAVIEGVLELVSRWLGGDLNATRAEVETAAVTLVTGLEDVVRTPRG